MQTQRYTLTTSRLQPSRFCIYIYMKPMFILLRMNAYTTLQMDTFKVKVTTYGQEFAYLVTMAVTSSLECLDEL